MLSTLNDLTAALTGEWAARVVYTGKRNIEHALLCFFSAFLDCQRDFLCLSVSETNTAIAIAHNNKCCERETTSALYNLCNTVDMNHA